MEERCFGTKVEEERNDMRTEGSKKKGKKKAATRAKQQGIDWFSECKFLNR